MKFICYLVAFFLKFNLIFLDIDDQFNDSIDDIYFEILSPKDIQYSYRARLAKDFGSNFDRTLSNLLLVPVKPIDGCDKIINKKDLFRNIALIERGQCSFITKVINAELNGAIGAIIMDNDSKNDVIVEMIKDNSQQDTQIPGLFLSWKDGLMIKNSIEKSGRKGAVINIPLNMTFKNIYELRRAPWSAW